MTSSIHQSDPVDEQLLQRLAEFSQGLGLELMGTAPLLQNELGWLTPHAERLRVWVDTGQHAEMSWLSDRVEERCVPHQLLPEAKSAIIFWGNHHFEPRPPPNYTTARVARYAWGRDYHNILKKSLRKVSRWLTAEMGTFSSYSSVDTGAILERAVGERAHLGWIGRSTMLINQQLGTFGSLAVMFTDRALVQSKPAHPFRCGRCTQCITDCPTGALSEGGLDARLCISYWTIEHRGMIPRHFRPKIGDWVFGCDICQDVCPWNRKAPHADEAIWRPRIENISPDLLKWLNTSDEELDQQLLGSPLRRAKPEGLKRNACIVLANQGCVQALPVLTHVALTHPSEIVRATAIWACRVLGHTEIIALCAHDTAESVRIERQAVLDDLIQPLPV